MQFAKAYYHWFFLIQEAPLPEQMLEGLGPRYILARLGRGKSGIKVFDRRALAEYVRCFERALHDLRGLPRRRHHRSRARPEGSEKEAADAGARALGTARA